MLASRDEARANLPVLARRSNLAQSLWAEEFQAAQEGVYTLVRRVDRTCTTCIGRHIAIFRRNNSPRHKCHKIGSTLRVTGLILRYAKSDEVTVILPE